MNLNDYLQKRALEKNKIQNHRILCTKCIQPQFGCYCSQMQKFDPCISFVILIHPIEVKRRIATGRMSYLSLESSYLIEGQNYTEIQTVNTLIDDPEYYSVILYPGQNSKNLSPLSNSERSALFPKNKKLRIFVIDGTWATARKMVRQSENLKTLPRICFSPEKPSTFRVRKQPNKNCYSTIEAIHHTIELIGFTQKFDTESREHDNLLTVFDYMVEKQLGFIRESNLNPKITTYRREVQKNRLSISTKPVIFSDKKNSDIVSKPLKLFISFSLLLLI